MVGVNLPELQIVRGHRQRDYSPQAEFGLDLPPAQPRADEHREGRFDELSSRRIFGLPARVWLLGIGYGRRTIVSAVPPRRLNQVYSLTCSHQISPDENGVSGTVRGAVSGGQHEGKKGSGCINVMSSIGELPGSGRLQAFRVTSKMREICEPSVRDAAGACS